MPRQRADAQRNRTRVLEGAKLTFAAQGFDASYHAIARVTGVGVGTVYRCYPDRTELLEAILLDIVEGLASQAEGAVANPDPWEAFASFFREFAALVQRHTGLSERLGGRGGDRVAAARERLLRAVDALVERAQRAGLRRDADRHHVLFLAQAAAAQGCGLDLDVDETQRAQAVAIMLDGLRG